MHIIPAIDIIEGKAVRLEQGQYDRKTTYYNDPLDAAIMFADAGIRRLHLVDLDGAKANQVKNWRVLQRIAAKTDLIIDFGGGVKRDEDLEIVFENGAAQATVGSIAAEKPELFHKWLSKYGPEKLILGADLIDGKVATRGWKETSDFTWSEFLNEHVNKGVSYVVCTDISKDGMLTGPAVSLYRDILATYANIKLIASGGVSNLADLLELEDVGCYGAIVGKAIYEGRIALKDLEKFADVS
ncbi:MAG: 1-(5-phosphoribosyl)-5-[(5-phosphoribosylamino)methylideneamino]imidazole-4-carboxamide isomerase [Saprospiraceae bacterium]|nr:1-(5-phosphoribosyl)-5-[(5-phosphoribosylamino)methylideneamino]imidazole-4-carboxamide isomerase [Saprospiraceae bacterium]